MNDSFFGASGGGDPVWVQHVAWFFGHPQTWLMVLIWVLALTGVVRIARHLWKAGKKHGLALYLSCVGVVLVLYLIVARAAFFGFVEGRLEDVIPMQTANGLLAVCALLSTVWLVFERFKAKRTQVTPPD